MKTSWPSAALLSAPLGGVREALARARGKLARIGAGIPFRPRIDPADALLSCVILLLTVGTVMVASASFFHRSVEGDPYFFLRRQALWLPIAILSGVLAARLDYRALARGYWLFLLAAVGLLCLVFIPGVGMELNGARRWIHAGSMQFQPSELGKLAAIVFIAGFLANDPGRARLFWKGFVPLAGGLFLLLGLILVEPDFGTSLFVFLLSGSVMMIAGMRKRFAVLSGLLAAPPVAAFMFLRWEQIRPRLLGFVEPERIYQVKQSLIALGAGGLEGSGLGAGAQKLKFLPEPQTDFIFAVIGEELGLLGSIGVILLFVGLLWSGAVIARRARDYFGFLVASGIVISLALQAAINIAVVTATGPTKGIPLPFITFGGSGLVMTLIQVGFLVSVSRSNAGGAEAPERSAP
jgi:cell division protein FtsW